MRINKFIAQATGLSRRTADSLVAEGQVSVDGQRADPGQDVTLNNNVKLGNRSLSLPDTFTTILLNKPIGYVCSRNAQGNRTVYDLPPQELSRLKTIGRLDKNSSGIILLTDDGQLSNKLSHPRHQKNKIYQVNLDKQLTTEDLAKITTQGVRLEDGSSKFSLQPNNNGAFGLTVTLQEGRNRQIRRTFQALGYKVLRLHRTSFGEYKLGDLQSGKYKIL